MKDKFFLLIGIIVIVWSFYAFLNNPAPAKFQSIQQDVGAQRILKIGESQINIEIADTDEERTLGLSGRETLLSGNGLFFIFDKPGNYGFWMKDMNFPIDIVWLSESGSVISIDEKVDASTYPKIFNPATPAKYVLEIPSGEAKRLNIKIGSQANLEDVIQFSNE